MDGSHSTHTCALGLGPPLLVLHRAQAMLCLVPGPRQEFPSPGLSYSCSCMLWPWVLCGQSGHSDGGHAPTEDASGEQMCPSDEEVILCFYKW